MMARWDRSVSVARGTRQATLASLCMVVEVDEHDDPRLGGTPACAMKPTDLRDSLVGSAPHEPDAADEREGPDCLTMSFR